MTEKKLKRIFFLVLAISLTNCAGLQNSSFKIKEGLYEISEEEKLAVELHFEYISPEIQFHTIYFKNRIAPLKLKSSFRTASNLIYRAEFKNPETDFIMDKDPIQEAGNRPPLPFKPDENEAVLEYKLKGKTRYYKLNLIQSKPASSFTNNPENENSSP